jgi:hypothetical protein
MKAAALGARWTIASALSRRHLLLNEFREAQERLLASHALVIGAGGLGSAALLYLASSGVGHIVVCDGDTVDLTNLQRQIVHRLDSLGKPKASTAAATMAQLNPDIRIKKALYALGRKAHGLVRADGPRLSDNPRDGRVEQACVAASQTPGSGRHPVPRPGRGIRPAPRGRAVPSPPVRRGCRGGRGALRRCVFALRVSARSRRWRRSSTTGIGETLAGRPMLFDALASRWHEVRLMRDPDCRVCGAARVAA